MNKLSDLAKHLLAMPGVGRDQMEAFADMGSLKLTAQDLGQGFEIGRFRYDAVISIERFPAKIATLLLADLLIWLGENDPNRDKLDLDDPEVDVSIEDECHVSVQITVPFDEPIRIIQDDDGLLDFRDQRWSVGEVPVDIAEVLDRMEKR